MSSSPTKWYVLYVGAPIKFDILVAFHPEAYAPGVLSVHYTNEGDKCYFLSDRWYVAPGTGRPNAFDGCTLVPSPPCLVQEVTDAQAFKADDGKPNWFLLMSGKGCARALAGVVRVLSFAVRSKDKGGKGYAEHSWREVPNAKERYQAALYRHLNKLELGESHDDESGESHWYHVATNALFLAELHNAEEKQ